MDNPEVLGVMIPIIMMLSTAAVFIVYFYLRSRERQLLISKGFTAEEMRQLYFSEKRDLQIWARLGILAIGIGAGIGLGEWWAEITGKGYSVAVMILICGGISMIAAQYLNNFKKK